MTDTDDLTNRLTFARHDLTVAREAVEFYPHGDAIRISVLEALDAVELALIHLGEKPGA